MSSLVRRSDPFRASAILVVESSAVRGAPDTCRLLRGLGYRAETAPSARAALDSVQRQPGRFAAVLADVLLQGMDGGELAERLRGTGPRIVLMVDRDHDGAEAAELLAAYPTIPTLEKPLTLSALYFLLAVTLAIPPVNVPVRKPTPLRPPRRSGERHTIQ